jgi:hypothetical protein
MTAQLKAQQMVENHGLIEAINRCKKILAMVYEHLEIDPTEANSSLFQFWGEVMDFLLTLVA